MQGWGAADCKVGVRLIARFRCVQMKSKGASNCKIGKEICDAAVRAPCPERTGVL